MKNTANMEKAYQIAKEKYERLDVDTETALAALDAISLSLHCWQGDDVGGFERPGAGLEGGGIQVTGNYPGKARTAAELRSDLEKAYSLIPGLHRLNLHAMYGEFGGRRIERNEIEPHHFEGWIEWAKTQHLKIDFNCTCFSHPKAESGFTLSSKNKDIRQFWIEHVSRCRTISAFIGRELGSPCIHNLWIPDGSKDIPADRLTHRALLKESLDEIYAAEYPVSEMKDSVESKLFGIGSESFVTGSHEFYMGYALKKGKMLCLDLGHFHPTESVADKLSSILLFSDELLLHMSRGVRWDSDHVAILSDDMREVCGEIVRNDFITRVHLALDFFDGSMNRVGAWVIGARAVLKALLIALLEPAETLRNFEEAGDYFSRLALMEELKSMPFGAVWDYHCLRKGLPAGDSWLNEIRRYEVETLRKRSQSTRGITKPQDTGNHLQEGEKWQK
ncbi:MAG: L-rhamnose isomerase [Candidatus Abyssobacteria bacterium SURF_5]|uniref:L-rhamnose isomerase n=1 Tax=Abyssobacteria bacterium (strain SURF_5) TaxID=2093360 RepID=A0A3A4P3R3_ABYX5|nr:MAG: L-rhamnose isomerase [Candidatus Abyssubacteria bacterium SURF_5]